MAASGRLFVATILVAWIGALAGGCDRGDSSQTSSAPAAKPGEQARQDGADDSAAADAGSEDADAQDAPAPAKTTPVATTPTPDVAFPPTVDGEPVKAGFIFYVAKDKPGPLAAFHQKDLEAKGWKLGRNETTPLAGTTLSGVVQEYAKGNEVLTVAVTPQIGEGDVAWGSVMDVPFPPKAKVMASYPYPLVETVEAPDAMLAWFRKEYAARGWSAGKQSESGITKTITFTKGGRTLQTMVLSQGGGNTGSRIQVVHNAMPG